MTSLVVRSLLQRRIPCYRSLSWSSTIHGSCDAQQLGVTKPVHSTNQANSVSVANERRELMALWPDIVRDLIEVKDYSDIPDTMKWMEKVLQYNVPNSRKLRALTIIWTYRTLTSPEQLTDENMRLARILAWCHEIVSIVTHIYSVQGEKRWEQVNQIALFIQDDIMDHAKLRRGQLCWHVHNNNGLTVINDSMLLEHAVYQLLKTHFGKKEYYVNLFETFHEITQKTMLGQSMDLCCGEERNLNLFTMKRYDLIIKYKASYYFFWMPVKLAMHLAGINPELHMQAKAILFDMAYLYQVQNDYMDSYGDPSVVGKIGTDIQAGKCSWLSVVALQHATPSQRQIMQECYGYDDLEKVARVKQLYDDLKLPTIYADYEKTAYNRLNTRIRQISWDPLHHLLLNFLSLIYGRQA